MILNRLPPTRCDKTYIKLCDRPYGPITQQLVEKGGERSRLRQKSKKQEAEFGQEHHANSTKTATATDGIGPPFPVRHLGASVFGGLSTHGLRLSHQ